MGYVSLIQKKNPLYDMEVCKDELQLLLAKVPSHFRAAIAHHVYISYDAALERSAAIIGYACTCQVGQINVGACSHTTAVIWYLAYERHSPSHKRVSTYAQNILSAAETCLQIEDPDAGSDAEDNIEGDIEDSEEDELLDV